MRQSVQIFNLYVYHDSHRRCKPAITVYVPCVREWFRVHGATQPWPGRACIYFHTHANTCKQIFKSWKDVQLLCVRVIWRRWRGTHLFTRSALASVSMNLVCSAMYSSSLVSSTFPATLETQETTSLQLTAGVFSKDASIRDATKSLMLLQGACFHMHGFERRSRRTLLCSKYM